MDSIGKWLLIALMFLVALSLFPIKLDVRFYREPNLIILNTKACLWLLPIEINLVNPMTKAIHRMSENSFWYRKTPEDLQAEEVPWRRLIARLRLFSRVGRPIWQLTNTFFHRICKPVKVKRLYLHTEIGLEDAAETALAAGLIWGCKGIVYSRLAALFNTKEAENSLAVVPNYMQPGYVRLDYSCIFEFRLGHIIIMIYYTLHSIGEIRELLRRISR